MRKIGIFKQTIIGDIIIGFVENKYQAENFVNEFISATNTKIYYYKELDDKAIGQYLFRTLCIGCIKHARNCHKNNEQCEKYIKQQKIMKGEYDGEQS